MRVAHVTHSLAGSTGVQTYMTTVGDAMQRVGHEVWLSADELGTGAEQARQLALAVADSHTDLPADLDVAFVHSSVASHALAEVRPELPQVFIVHGRFFDNYVPPQIDGRVAGVATLGGFARSRVDSTAIQVPHKQLLQPIDRTRFRDRNPIAERPRRALILSNYLEGERLERLREASKIAGIELDHAGASGGAVALRPEDAINKADIVFGKGRAIIEAMACGRAAYVYDMWGTDGWVTPETYEQMAERGFGGNALARDLSAAELAEDLAGYSNELGAWGMSTVIENHLVEDHVAELLELCPQAPSDAKARDEHAELARLARQSWRHEGQVHVLSEQVKVQNQRISDLENELHRLQSSRSWRITAPLRRIRRNNS